MTPQASQPSIWVPARIWLRRLRGTAVWQGAPGAPPRGDTPPGGAGFPGPGVAQQEVSLDRRGALLPRGAGHVALGLDLPGGRFEAGPLAALVLLHRDQPALGLLEGRFLLLGGFGGLDPVALLAGPRRAGEVHLRHQRLGLARGAG